MGLVFLSWSGERSLAVARALKDWLPNVFQGLDVWMSDHDIQAGSRWGRDLSEKLEASNFGVVCLTPESLESDWLIFEAGALSKAIDRARVVPYRFGLTAAEVGPPLAQFQGVDATHAGTRSLVRSLNDTRANPLPTEQLEKTFERWWGDLRDALQSIADPASARARTEREMLEEILDLVRRTGSRELREELGRILGLKNVHSVRVAQKIRGGHATGEVAFVIRVYEKLSSSQVPVDERIPSEIYGMATDIVQARPK